MKNIFLFMFVFSFLFTGFSVNASESGCDGTVFNSITGAKCTVSTPVVSICPLNMPNPFSLCSDGKIEPATRDSNQCVTSYKCVTPKDNEGCPSGVIFNSITGAKCPVIETPVIPTDHGCNGSVFSSTTGARCPVSIIETKSGCNGFIFNSITGAKCSNIETPVTPTDHNSLPNTVTPIRRTLKLGIKGEEVKTLQTFLGLLADGSFGLKTQAKVIEWQKANGLIPDGSFGNMSRQKANLGE